MKDMYKKEFVHCNLVSFRKGEFFTTMVGAILLPRGDIYIVNICRVRKEGGRARFPMRLDRTPQYVRRVNGKPCVLHILKKPNGLKLFQITATGKHPVESEWCSRMPDIHDWTHHVHLKQLSELLGMDVRATQQNIWRDYREMPLGDFLRAYEDASMVYDAAMRDIEDQAEAGSMELETVAEDAPVHAGEMQLEKARPSGGRANQNKILNQREAQVAGILKS